MATAVDHAIDPARGDLAIDDVIEDIEDPESESILSSFEGALTFMTLSRSTENI